MKELVLLKNNNPITTSEIVAEGVKKSHKSIIQLIRTYENDLNEFGTLAFQMRKSGGRHTEFYYLNEQHVTFLITLMRNTKIVIEFKKAIIKEFFKMRKTLLGLATQKANTEWLETRTKGKVSRLKETDALKTFRDYAINQGSEGYKKEDAVYIVFTNMENKALFVIDSFIVKDLKKKKKSLRELLKINQLDEIKQADEIVLKALNDGMCENMSYKDIYKLAKKRVELFVSLKGRSIIPNIDFKRIKYEEEE